MRALSITHPDITKERLLQEAEKIHGAWIGIRIAGYLLLLSGWKSSQVASLFGLTRWSVVKWIHKANQEGAEALWDGDRKGRPSRFDEVMMRKLDKALSKSPKEHGLSRTRWDGIVVVEYLKRTYQIDIHVRHAQRLLKQLGYSLRRPIYRYVQASDKGVKEFYNELKKTPSRAKKQQ